MTERHDTRIGTTIAALREQRGWSQRALAKVVGLDQSAVSRIEAGKRRVAVGELEAVAQALGVPPAALLESSPTPLATTSARRSGKPAGAPDQPALERGAGEHADGPAAEPPSPAARRGPH